MNNNPPFWPTWRSGYDYSGYAPNTFNDPNLVQPVFRHPISFQPTADAGRGSREPWQMPNGRVLTPTFSSSGFPDERAVNPRFSGPLPRYTVQQATPTRQEDFLSSNQEEQNSVLSKLKKEIYNPNLKRMTKRLSSFYREQNRSKEKEKDDDSKGCAICLDDFEPRDQVMVTPCDHMFHEKCILPWVKSHDQCPVYRFVLGERTRQTAASASISNNNVSNVPITDLFEPEEIAFIIAMEEVYLWGN